MFPRETGRRAPKNPLIEMWLQAPHSLCAVQGFLEYPGTHPSPRHLAPAPGNLFLGGHLPWAVGANGPLHYVDCLASLSQCGVSGVRPHGSASFRRPSPGPSVRAPRFLQAFFSRWTLGRACLLAARSIRAQLVLVHTWVLAVVETDILFVTVS